MLFVYRHGNSVGNLETKLIEVTVILWSGKIAYRFSQMWKINYFVNNSQLLLMVNSNFHALTSGACQNMNHITRLQRLNIHWCLSPEQCSFISMQTLFLLCECRSIELKKCTEWIRTRHLRHHHHIGLLSSKGYRQCPLRVPTAKLLNWRTRWFSHNMTMPMSWLHHRRARRAKKS